MLVHPPQAPFHPVVPRDIGTFHTLHLASKRRLTFGKPRSSALIAQLDVASLEPSWI